MDNTTARGKRFTQLLGDQIRGEASKRRMPAKELAAKIGIHEVTMSKYLNAKLIPPASFVSDCADALGVSAGFLVEQAYDIMLSEMGTLSEANFTLAASDADIDSHIEGQQEEP